MADFMRKMIEEMMGQEALDGETHQTLTYDSPNVCRSYLEGFCINKLFVNTKLDSGDCSKVHSPKLRDAYEADKASGKDVTVIELELEQQLLRYVNDCNRKIEVAQKRMASDPSPAKAAKLTQEVEVMEKEITEMSAQAEKFGEEGEVDKAMELMTKIDELKAKKNEMETEIRTMTAHDANPNQRVRVCEICAAQLSSSDEDKRIADHFTGKTHVGFQKIRGLLANLRARFDERRVARAKADSDRRLQQQEQDNLQHLNQSQYSSSSSSSHSCSAAAASSTTANHHYSQRARERDREREKSTDRRSDSSLRRDRRRTSVHKDHHRESRGQRRSSGRRGSSRSRRYSTSRSRSRSHSRTRSQSRSRSRSQSPRSRTRRRSPAGAAVSRRGGSDRNGHGLIKPTAITCTSSSNAVVESVVAKEVEQWTEKVKEFVDDVLVAVSGEKEEGEI